MHDAVRTRRSGSWARSLTALAVTLLLSGALLMIGAPAASAHENMLASSVPAASTTVAEPPERVVLNFRWPIRPESAMVAVIGPDGATQWQHGKAEVSNRSIAMVLRPLEPAGRYAVRYRGVSGWGYPFHGEVAFTLAQPVTEAPTTQAPPVSTGTGDSGLPLAWIASVVLLTAAAATVGVRLGRTLP